MNEICIAPTISICNDINIHSSQWRCLCTLWSRYTKLTLIAGRKHINCDVGCVLQGESILTVMWVVYCRERAVLTVM